MRLQKSKLSSCYEVKHKNYRAWKSGKSWVYAAMTLTAIFGASLVTVAVKPQTVDAATTNSNVSSESTAVASNSAAYSTAVSNASAVNSQNSVVTSDANSVNNAISDLTSAVNNSNLLNSSGASAYQSVINSASDVLTSQLAVHSASNSDYQSLVNAYNSDLSAYQTSGSQVPPLDLASYSNALASLLNNDSSVQSDASTLASLTSAVSTLTSQNIETSGISLANESANTSAYNEASNYYQTLVQPGSVQESNAALSLSQQNSLLASAISTYNSAVSDTRSLLDTAQKSQLDSNGSLIYIYSDVTDSQASAAQSELESARALVLANESAVTSATTVFSTVYSDYSNILSLYQSKLDAYSSVPELSTGISDSAYNALTSTAASTVYSQYLVDATSFISTADSVLSSNADVVGGYVGANISRNQVLHDLSTLDAYKASLSEAGSVFTSVTQKSTLDYSQILSAYNVVSNQDSIFQSEVPIYLTDVSAYQSDLQSYGAANGMNSAELSSLFAVDPSALTSFSADMNSYKLAMISFAADYASADVYLSTRDSLYASQSSYPTSMTFSEYTSYYNWLSSDYPNSLFTAQTPSQVSDTMNSLRDEVNSAITSASLASDATSLSYYQSELGLIEAGYVPIVAGTDNVLEPMNTDPQAVNINVNAVALPNMDLTLATGIDLHALARTAAGAYGLDQLTERFSPADFIRQTTVAQKTSLVTQQLYTGSTGSSGWMGQNNITASFVDPTSKTTYTLAGVYVTYNTGYQGTHTVSQIENIYYLNPSDPIGDFESLPISFGRNNGQNTNIYFVYLPLPALPTPPTPPAPVPINLPNVNLAPVNEMVTPGPIGSIKAPTAPLSFQTITGMDIPTPSGVALRPTVPSSTPTKDVTKTDNGDSIDDSNPGLTGNTENTTNDPSTGNVGLDSNFVYELNSRTLWSGRDTLVNWSLTDHFDAANDQYLGTFNVYQITNGQMSSTPIDNSNNQYFTQTYDNTAGTLTYTATQAWLDQINAMNTEDVAWRINADFYRYTDSTDVQNSFGETVNDSTEESNTVNTHTDKPQPHKFDLNDGTANLTNNDLLNDDTDIASGYQPGMIKEPDGTFTQIVDITGNNPYADGTGNNSSVNINTATLNRGDHIQYQLWLDTTPYDNTSLLTSIGMTDNFDATRLDANAGDVHVYDAAGNDVTKYFTATINNGVLTVTANVSSTQENGFVNPVAGNAGVLTKNSQGQTEAILNTALVPLGSYYKISFPTTIKSDAPAGDIINVASQNVVDNNGKGYSDKTETRVNNVPPVPPTVPPVTPPTTPPAPPTTPPTTPPTVPPTTPPTTTPPTAPPSTPIVVPETPAHPAQPNHPTRPTLPETGDSSNAALILDGIVTIGAAGVILVADRKRRKFQLYQMTQKATYK